MSSHDALIEELRALRRERAEGEAGLQALKARIGRLDEIAAVAAFFRKAGIEVSEAQPGTPSAKPAIEGTLCDIAVRLERVEALIAAGIAGGIRAIERQTDVLKAGRSR